MSSVADGKGPVPHTKRYFRFDSIAVKDMPDGVIYLDHNATTPVAPEVLAALEPYLREYWGNPSSAYRFATSSQAALDAAREQVAQLVQASPGDVVFTSGATEANNTAIHAALLAQPTKRHVVTTQVEHASVLGYCQSLEQRGIEMTYLPVNGDGQLDLDLLRASIRPDTAVVSAMWANNETGVLWPVDEIGFICLQKKTLFHCDAAQATGKVPVDFNASGIDYLTLSGHKLGAPKGIGALVLRPQVPFAPLLVGGKQEGGRRGGTESVPLIVALGAACEWARYRGPQAWESVARLRDQFELQLKAALPEAYRNGEGARLPNTANFGLPGIDSDGLVAFLDSRQICVSSGSACLANSLSPSHVILAMSQNHQRANEALRVSLGLKTTADELNQLLAALKEFVSRSGTRSAVPSRN